LADIEVVVFSGIAGYEASIEERKGGWAVEIGSVVRVTERSR